MPGPPSDNWTMRQYWQYWRVLAPPGKLGPSFGTDQTSKAQVTGGDGDELILWGRLGWRPLHEGVEIAIVNDLVPGK